jgi:spore coat protein U-like protein
VTIDAGLAFGNGTRRMTLGAGADFLAYEVYVDSARTIVWSSTPVSVPAGNGATVPFFGRVFAQQDVSVGAYTDTLTVTFNF